MSVTPAAIAASKTASPFTRARYGVPKMRPMTSRQLYVAPAAFPDHPARRPP